MFRYSDSNAPMTKFDIHIIKIMQSLKDTLSELGLAKGVVFGGTRKVE
ncbi:hypothetical protein BNJ_00206 [Kaumoebavirus]|nr:hypothetical protein BNJ_00206 [Kaumoebavirus]ARA72036.1 hypothetical protein BNJ_00206 [Kaumoebavirus]